MSLRNSGDSNIDRNNALLSEEMLLNGSTTLVDDEDFHMWMGVWLPGTICVFGMLGNALAFYVLSRDRSRSTTFLSLQALSMSDFILLLSALLQQIIPMLCLASGSVNRYCLDQGYVRVYVWPVICLAQMASMWFAVLISAERCVAICFPLRAAHVCTLPRIRMAITTITISSIVFNIPRFFEFQPAEEDIPHLNITRIVVGYSELRTNPVYRYLYNTALHCLVLFAFPLTILTVLNVKLVRRIKSARKNWRLLNRAQRREMKATKLPLVIVLVYFFCGTQSLISFILDAIFVDFFEGYGWLQNYTAVVNLLVILNSAVNFILMYCFGSRFRHMLKRTLCCAPKSGRRMLQHPPQSSIHSDAFV